MKDYYNNFELVDEKFCMGLKTGELFLFATDEPNRQKRAVGEILVRKGIPNSNIIMEYWPEYTPVTNPSMIQLRAIKSIEQKEGYKLITTKKLIEYKAVSEDKEVNRMYFWEDDSMETILKTFKDHTEANEFVIEKTGNVK